MEQVPGHESLAKHQSLNRFDVEQEELDLGDEW
jgi:hypothetical protein